MELQTEKKGGASLRRFGAEAMVSAGLIVSSFVANESLDNEPVIEDASLASISGKPTWELEWKDNFNGPELSSRWKVVDNTYRTWDRFAQYRQFGVTMRGGKVIVSSRRHCVAPGEDVSMSNDQSEPCLAGFETRYSSGRVEQVTANIEGDYKVEVVAKMPQYQDARGAVWMNNLSDDQDDTNAGYC